MFVFAVDLGISVQEDSVAASSPKTVDTSAVAAASGKNPGKEAKPRAPAAKSHFFLPLSRPVPGRTGDRGEDSSEPARAPGQPDVSSAGALGDKGASDSMALRPAAARGPGPDKTPGRTPADHHGLAATPGPAPLPPESGGAAPSKPKDSGFFNKLFKLDKGQEKAPAVSHQEAECAAREDQAFDIPGFPGPAHDVPAERVSADGTVRPLWGELLWGRWAGRWPTGASAGTRALAGVGASPPGTNSTLWRCLPSRSRNICLQTGPAGASVLCKSQRR